MIIRDERLELATRRCLKLQRNRWGVESIRRTGRRRKRNPPCGSGRGKGDRLGLVVPRNLCYVVVSQPKQLLRTDGARGH
jgi:hypothetical protein